VEVEVTVEVEVLVVETDDVVVTDEEVALVSEVEVVVDVLAAVVSLVVVLLRASEAAATWLRDVCATLEVEMVVVMEEVLVVELVLVTVADCAGEAVGGVAAEPVPLNATSRVEVTGAAKVTNVVVVEGSASSLSDLLASATNLSALYLAKSADVTVASGLRWPFPECHVSQGITR